MLSTTCLVAGGIKIRIRRFRIKGIKGASVLPRVSRRSRLDLLDNVFLKI